VAAGAMEPANNSERSSWIVGRDGSFLKDTKASTSDCKYSDSLRGLSLCLQQRTDRSVGLLARKLCQLTLTCHLMLPSRCVT